MLDRKTLRFIWTQKEGVIVGALWGLLSCFASLGLATAEVHILWWQKLLIMPVYLTGLVFKINNFGWPVILVPVLIGALIGAIVDMVYKPKQ